MTLPTTSRNKKELLTFLFILVSIFAFGQIINIPDPVLKGRLLASRTTSDIARNAQGERIKIDVNDDDEISYQEALVVDKLWLSGFGHSPPYIASLVGISGFVNLRELDCSKNEITSFQGVQTLSNLKKFDCGENDLTSLVGLNNFPNVEELNCNNNYLTSAALNGIESLTNLKELDCHGAYLTSLDGIQGLTNLDSLVCHNNQLTSLNELQALTNLEYLICYNNELTSLNGLQALTNLEFLDCERNQLTSLNGIEALVSLKSLGCHDNQLTSLNEIQGLISLESLDCYNNQITSLNGIQNLINLIGLHCHFNQISSLEELQGLISLESLDCSSNQISSLEGIENLSNLKFLYCNSNQISSLDEIENLSKLWSISCTNNQLTNINVQNQPNLWGLSCSNNQLTSLSVQGLLGMEELECDSNQLTSIDLVGLDSLKRLKCHSNQLTSLDLQDLFLLRSVNCSDNQLPFLNASSLSYLTVIDCRDNELRSIYLKNAGWPGLSIEGNPDLAHICCTNSSNHINAAQTIVDNAGYTNCVVNSFCSSTAIVGDFNIIQGSVSFDSANNDCNSGDVGIPLKIKITDGTSENFVLSNENYQVYIGVGIEDYTLTPILENPYFMISPEFAEINFDDDAIHEIIQDFCIIPDGNHDDLEITILPITVARPGFDAEYELIYENKGTTTLSGNIVLNYMDEILDLINTSQTTTSQNTGELIWSYSNLAPFESYSINIGFNVNSPVETPAVEIDDILVFTANIQSTENEETPDDNISIFNQIVVGSYDPNDKTCLEGTRIKPEQVGEFLHYVIRFENTGTYPAENVVVRDVIDETKFDISSLAVTSSSHAMLTRIRGNKVEFIFEGINLPYDDASNDGYVAFKIRTLDHLVLDDEVSNKANIYFDFNAPIITNNAITQIALYDGSSSNTPINIAPNPVRETLYFEHHLMIKKVEIFDVAGHLIFSGKVENAQLDVSTLQKGIYFVRVFAQERVTSLKIIKE